MNGIVPKQAKTYRSRRGDNNNARGRASRDRGRGRARDDAAARQSRRRATLQRRDTHTMERGEGSSSRGCSSPSRPAHVRLAPSPPPPASPEHHLPSSHGPCRDDESLSSLFVVIVRGNVTFVCTARAQVDARPPRSPALPRLCPAVRRHRREGYARGVALTSRCMPESSAFSQCVETARKTGSAKRGRYHRPLLVFAKGATDPDATRHAHGFFYLCPEHT